MGTSFSSFLGISFFRNICVFMETFLSGTNKYTAASIIQNVNDHCHLDRETEGENAAEGLPAKETESREERSGAREGLSLKSYKLRIWGGINLKK